MEETPTMSPSSVIVPELNQLSAGVRIFGLALFGAIIAFTIYCIVWVQAHRKVPSIKAYQPFFLTILLVGLFLIELAIIPLSIDDQIASQRGCDIACMSERWLTNMGNSLLLGALYSKLRRINMLFHNQGGSFRKMKVAAKDVIHPIIVLCMINFVLMLTWQLKAPLHWTRQPVEDDWVISYGVCSYSDTFSLVFDALTGFVLLVAQILVCWQAWKARTINDKYSESRKLAIVGYNFLQLQVIGAPAIALIKGKDASVKHYMEVIIFAAGCLSVLLVIFLPFLLDYRNAKRNGASSSSLPGGTVRVSGLAGSGTSYVRQASSTRTTSTYLASNGVDLMSPEEATAIKSQLLELQEKLTDLKKRNLDLEEKNEALEQLVVAPGEDDEESGMRKSFRVVERHEATDSTSVMTDDEEAFE